MKRFNIKAASATEVAAWLKEPGRTTYLCDVRTPEEFAAGSIAGAQHTPGGQLIQATDQWVGVRNARIVLIDGGDMVRAPVVASWLLQLGCDACVLDGGIKAGLEGIKAATPVLPALSMIAPAELKTLIEHKACTVFDVGPSMAYRKAHVPGSRWTIRSRLLKDAKESKLPIVLVAAEHDVAKLAASELINAGIKDIRLLEGGVTAWVKAGYSSASSTDIPADRECIDYLFFVHDRHAGNREAMKQYLAWETGLMAQLGEQDKSVFRFPGH